MDKKVAVHSVPVTKNFCCKQYITVDNSVTLLYTVCNNGGQRYAYYFESYVDGSDLRAGR